MAKRTARNSKKLFNFDLESIFDLSQEEKSEPQASRDSYNQTKKFKPKDTKPTMAAKDEESFSLSEANFSKKMDYADAEDVNDLSKFFENIGNDFNKSIKERKMKLSQFADSVILLYETKISEMLNKMEDEVEMLKEQAGKNIQEELNKFDSEFSTLQLQENKLMKILDQQIKLIQKTAKFQEQWSETFAKLHQNFVQDFMDLKKKHKAEALEMKKMLESDIVNLQNKFISETKKEEMQTMKTYISSIYF